MKYRGETPQFFEDSPDLRSSTWYTTMSLHIRIVCIEYCIGSLYFPYILGENRAISRITQQTDAQETNVSSHIRSSHRLLRVFTHSILPPTTPVDVERMTISDTKDNQSRRVLRRGAGGQPEMLGGGAKQVQPLSTAALL